jgi:hypothetical protein
MSHDGVLVAEWFEAHKVLGLAQGRNAGSNTLLTYLLTYLIVLSFPLEHRASTLQLLRFL